MQLGYSTSGNNDLVLFHLWRMKAVLKYKKVSDIIHCVKFARIWSYSSPYFSAFGMNNSEHGHFTRSDFVKDL